jgi:Reverse transcriptase (RNA-dependent DNA polymerase)
MDELDMKLHLVSKLRDTDDEAICQLAMIADGLMRNTTFEGMCEFLVTQAAAIDRKAQEYAHRQSRPALRKFGNAANANLAAVLEEQGQLSATESEFMCGIIPAYKKDPTFLSDEKFQALEPEVQQIIRELRRRAAQNKGGRRQDRGQETQPHTNNSASNNNAKTPRADAPLQYPNKAMATNTAQIEGSGSYMHVEYKPSSSDNKDYDIANVTEADITALLHHSFNSTYYTMNTVCDPALPTITTALYEHQANAARITDEAFVICDNGAQCSILGGLGGVWRVTEMDTLRTINVIGAVPSSMRKKGLRVVSAVTKVKTTEGKTILLRVNEAAFNPESRVTLLSEYQVREFGCVIDSVSKSHKTAHKGNQYGSQSFMPTEDVTIQLHSKAALMTFPISMPTEMDLLSMDIIDITSDDPWVPHTYNSEDNATDPLAANHMVQGPTGNRSATDPPGTVAGESRYAKRDSAMLVLDVGSMGNISTEWLGQEGPPATSELVDVFLHRLEQDELMGRNRGGTFDSLTFASFATRRFRGESQSITQPPLLWPADTWVIPPYVQQSCPDNCQQMAILAAAIHDDPAMPGEDSPEHHDIPVPAEISDTGFRVQARHRLDNLEAVRPYLGWLPARIVSETIKRTTQLAKAVVRFHMVRHLKSRFANLRMNRLKEVVAMDTFFANTPSYQHGYTMAQVFYGTSSHMINVYGLRRRENVKSAILDFLRDEGAPWAFRMDGGREQSSREVDEVLRDLHVKIEMSEPYNQQQNPAELKAVKWLKQHAQTLMDRTGASSKAWFMACAYLADVHNITSDESLRFGIPMTVRHGETVDISAFLNFRFFEKVYYLDPNVSFPDSKESTGRWLGVAHSMGDALTYYILTDDTHRIITRSVVRPFDERTNNGRLRFHEYEKDGPAFDTPTNRGDPTPTVNHHTDAHSTTTVPTSNRHTQQSRVEDDVDADTNDDPSPVHVLPRRSKCITNPTPWKGGRDARGFVATIVSMLLMAAKVYVPYGNAGNALWNIQSPLFNGDTALQQPGAPNSMTLEGQHEHRCICTSLTNDEVAHMHYVQMADFTADVLEDQLWNGDHAHRAAAVLNHKVRNKDSADRHLKLQVLWMNSDRSWVRMDDIRLDNSYVIVRYAKERGLTNKHDFAWTTQYTDNENKLYQVLMAQASGNNNAKAKYKFGVMVPRSVKHAMYLDKLNNDTGWMDALRTELTQINDYKTFRRLRDGEDLSHYKRIPCHIIFYVKFDLRKKARLVANGNLTDPTAEDVYSGVVATETIRLAFAVAAINGLLCYAGDVGNAFLYAYTSEKCYIIAGVEFGELAGIPLIIDKGLYGLRTSSARFHEHLASTLRDLGFTPSRYDNDLWMKDKDDHYEYITTYVDDVLVFSRDPGAVLEALKKVYIMKGVGVPQYYLGGNVEVLDETWQSKGIYTALSARTYIGNALEKIERLLGGPIFRSATPMSDTYHPELDDTNLLNPNKASIYRTIIGCANWIITLGRYDIQYAIMALSRFSMAP